MTTTAITCSMSAAWPLPANHASTGKPFEMDSGFGFRVSGFGGKAPWAEGDSAIPVADLFGAPVLTCRGRLMAIALPLADDLNHLDAIDAVPPAAAAAREPAAAAALGAMTRNQASRQWRDAVRATAIRHLAAAPDGLFLTELADRIGVARQGLCGLLTSDPRIRYDHAPMRRRIKGSRHAMRFHLVGISDSRRPDSRSPDQRTLSHQDNDG